MGQANFSPARISTDPKDYALQLSTVIHEVAHALGFSSSRFGRFINPLTGALLPSSSVLFSVGADGGGGAGVGADGGCGGAGGCRGGRGMLR
jgi:hypothetical protein